MDVKITKLKYCYNCTQIFNLQTTQYLKYIPTYMFNFDREKSKHNNI